MLTLMRRAAIVHILVMGGMLSWTTPSRASDLTDAIIDVDPRNELTSGTGVSYESNYAPEEPNDLLADPATLEPTLGQGVPYQGYFEGLRSPLYSAQDDSTSNTSAAPSTLTPFNKGFPGLIEEALPPLGKPEQREGVMYEDDLRAGSEPVGSY